MRSLFALPAQLVTPSLLFWKLITISRHIGYQEKNRKQSTAPIRNPCADTFRLALAASLSPARDRAGDSTAGLRSVLRSATVGQDLVDLAGRGGQELGDVRVRVGQHLEHDRVEGLVDGLRVDRLAHGQLVS